ncbi:hypothetical protein BT96DRAFT_981255 [Gymnopus androsaceus JB14]|uniref:Uncharacterized protein n=1 Tax=Gymnopus androsaceus JB14 TaxID=1447944 RepID=A0A6A4GRU3_9AGAR|nr:hypothetical protein BT96DRAFT_981255 [Gymnopus androsaceus JB14]
MHIANIEGIQTTNFANQASSSTSPEMNRHRFDGPLLLPSGSFLRLPTMKAERFCLRSSMLRMGLRLNWN